jgi:phosphomannomutase
MLWEQKAGQVLPSDNNERQTISDVRPTIVMGHDLSETSLEMMRESVRGVREQGCHIFDVGGVTPACMKFILELLQADAGVHATSRRKDGSGAGLDLYGLQAMPLSSESLYEVQDYLQQKQLTRYSRSDGGLTPFSPRKDYLESLRKHFQNIRPIRIWLNTTNDLVIDSLQELFLNLPGELIVSQERYAFNPVEKLDIKRLHPFQNHFMEEDCELGIIIDSQGQACHFLDANFREIPAAKILSLLYKQIKRNNTRDSNIAPLVMLGEELRADGITWNSATENIFRYRQSLREYFTRGMTTAKTTIGYDALHRYWFVDQSPVCDGIITLGKVLQAISTS